MLTGGGGAWRRGRTISGDENESTFRFSVDGGLGKERGRTVADPTSARKRAVLDGTASDGVDGLKSIL